ncbi:hypothetical protein V4C53_29075 [Paraburkholderia azotifigens]|uniref:hypothetical protein n=1 Tax=Paraburkholderia azotifigens TaxID=2057004 RepID=UPI00317B2008
MHKNNCRVCGYELAYPPWGDDGEDPSWEICPCCGTEFGYEDCTPVSAKRKREQWIAAGCPWFDRKKKSLDWDLKRQCEHIPEVFK